MRIPEPIILFIPDLLAQKLDKYLNTHPPGFKYDIAYFYYIIHYITMEHLRQKDKEYISLNIKYSRPAIISNIDKYIKILKNGEFIISDNHFIKGEKCLYYKLNLEFLQGIEKVKIQPGCMLFEKIIKLQNNKKAHYDRLSPYLQQMKNEFMNIDLDYDAAEKWIFNNVDEDKKYYYLTALYQFKDKRFRFFSRNKTNNRLDTSLTILPKELRQFILGDYMIIDLKNSQPLILSQVIEGIYDNLQTILLCSKFNIDSLRETFGIRVIQGISKSHQKQKNANLVRLKTFSKSAKNGILYEDFMESYPGKITRDEAKDIMLKVLYSRNVIHNNYKRCIPYEAEKKIFASVYPPVYDYVYQLKSKDHTKLPVYLQGMESHVFIDCIAKELVNIGIVPRTIHDSVIVKKSDLDSALNIIYDVFREQFDTPPPLHIKNLNNTK